jgi:hypothetical protein
MVNSFKSWDAVNESTKSKQVYVAPNGHRFKVVIRIQDNKNFMVKTVGEMQLLDTNSNMTNNGATAIKQYLNAQQAFLNTVGKIDNAFFTSQFIMYKVVRDNARKEKIQFTVTPRTEAPGMDAKNQFVSVDALAAIQSESLAGIIQGNEVKSKEPLDGETTKVETGTVADGEGSDITKDELGNRFRYTMSTNGITYVCTIGGNGQIEMEPYNGAKGAVGAISWESPKVIWYTDIDNKAGGAINNTPLYMDGEITNKRDKDWFTKFFTDEAFKDKVIKEYEDEYGDSEINGENLKGMLYYDDGTPIFGETSTDSEGAGATGTTHTASVDNTNIQDLIQNA